MKAGIRFAAMALVAGGFALGACMQQQSGGGMMASNMKTFHADLTAAQEVPPTNSAGKGTADFKLDTATKTLSWTVSYSGLTGPAAAAHIHGPNGAPGTNTGVMVPFNNVGASPITGSAVLTDPQIAALSAGTTYVNIHTAANKGGEIRGQIK